jgi:transposase
VQDLPSGGKAVRLVLRVRRFRCRNAGCSAVTFAERVPSVVVTSAQRSRRLSVSLSGLGLALGGNAGARLSQRLGMAASPSTVLRLVRHTAVPNLPTPGVLGVDDFALRKGQVYGTLLVDAETHRPVDVVRERTAEVLSAWLKAHSGVEIITRDRSGEYARGATEGAPQAVQVADRWHLMKNWREALERLLSRLHGELAHRPPSVDMPLTPAVQRPALDSQRPSRRAAMAANRARRYARYQTVQMLLKQGMSKNQIARQLGLARSTVQTLACAETYPERARRSPGKSSLDPYLSYLHQRFNEGCSNSRQLWRERQAQGYTGSQTLVATWVQYYRTSPAPSTPRHHWPEPSPTPLQPGVPSVLLPAPRHLVWYLLRAITDLTPEQQLVFAHIRRHPQVDHAYHLSRQFQHMIRAHSADEFTPWLHACLESALPELQAFATSLQREEGSIRLALATPWNNGLTEGHVNRLKLIKRSLYGRASFDLLRLRVLVAV